RPEQAPVASTAGERCEMCAEPIPPEGTVTVHGHGHVADLKNHSLLCTCRACFLLFTQRGAAGGRYRSVPDRFLHDPELALTPVQWDELQIPVKMAFLFRSSETEQWVAFYPSPAGSTESLLSLESWADVIEANPVLDTAELDVEAVLIQRTEDGNFEGFLVPITACYELVARVRMHWQGFSGGEKAHAEIAEFFAAVRERSERVS
ncbi:MAG: DUF5947 family protein, partial [Actinomycetota bacterium]|nr:DUF5947 family protein [Actinomycetota bacterium]